MPADRLPFEVQARALGERRLSEFFERNAHLHAMTMALNMSVLTAPATGYSDECMRAIATDAQDLAQSAQQFAEWAKALAADWGAQRVGHRVLTRARAEELWGPDPQKWATWFCTACGQFNSGWTVECGRCEAARLESDGV